MTAARRHSQSWGCPVGRGLALTQPAFNKRDAVGGVVWQEGLLGVVPFEHGKTLTHEVDLLSQVEESGCVSSGDAGLGLDENRSGIVGAVVRGIGCLGDPRRGLRGGGTGVDVEGPG